MNKKLNANFSMRKLLLTALVTGPLATLPAPLWALPQTDTASGNLPSSSGIASTQVVGSTLNITTNNNSAVLNWVQFGAGSNAIASGETINYFLPSSSASVLNNVTGASNTRIDGALLSNGNVYVLNPNGIIIGSTANITVGGFYASTIPEPSGFFAANGSLNFNGNATTDVTVEGTGATSAKIEAVNGTIFLAGNAVDIKAGQFYGNLNIRATSSGTLPSSGYYVSLGSSGNVSVNLNGPQANQGGSLNIVSNGGSVSLAGAGGNTSIAPVGTPLVSTVTINTTKVNGNAGTISQAGGTFAAGTSGTVTTLNAGTGTSAANITLGNANFVTLGASGKDVTIWDNSGAVTLNSVTTSGNFTLTANGNSILQAAGAVHNIGGNLTLAAGGNSTVTFTAAGNLTVGTNLKSGTITLVTTGDLTTKDLQTDNTLALTTTGGNITTEALTSNTLNVTASASGAKFTSNTNVSAKAGNVTVNGDIKVTSALTQGSTSTLGLTSTTGGITIGSIASVGSTLNLTAPNGTVNVGLISGTSAAVTLSGASITLGNVTAAQTLSATATTGSLTTGTITTASTLTLSAPSASGSITTGNFTLNGSALATISSGGSISLAGGQMNNINVTSTGGSITQAAGITSSTATFSAATDLLLTQATNNFGTIILQGGTAGSTYSVTESNGIVVGNGTRTNAPTSITVAAGNISLGNGAVDSIVFGSTLSLSNTSAAGVIATTANNVTVFGNVSLVTQSGNATLGNNALGGVANYSFGQVNANLAGGSLSIYENTTLNLGNITLTTGALDARSGKGDIVNSGKLSLGTGVALFAAGDIFTQNNISLTNTSNILANVVIGNAKDVTVVNSGAAALTVTAGSTSVNGKAATGAVFVNNTNALSTLTITTGTGTGGDFSTVGFSSANNVTVSDPNGLTLQNLSATGATTKVAISANGPITLGSGIALSNGNTTTFTSTYLAGNATPGITDSAPGIRIVGEAIFSSDGNINISQAGHTMGPVSLTTTGVAATSTTLAGGSSALTSITYVEAGTANLKKVSAGTASYPGAVNIVSTGGDIKQTDATSTITVLNGSSTTPTAVSFTASAGGVNLSTGINNFSVNSPVTITAAGNSSITQSTAQNLTLGNVIVTGGTFGVDVSGTLGNTIAQATGTTVKTYGAASFSSGGGKITLSNSGNNFGGLTLTSNVGSAAGADIAITESGVMNFLAVNSGTAGKLTAQSENASIIQTGTGSILVGGNTSLTASTGITLFTNTNNFGGSAIILSTPGNVSLNDANATTVLGGGTNIGGTLSLRNTHTSGGVNDGTIRDSLGNITVVGNVLLDTGSTAGSTIRFDSANSSFGAITFRSGNVTITETQGLNLGANSFAAGPVTLQSSLGGITTSGAGGSTFQNTLTLFASGGNITILNPIYVNGSGGSSPVGLTFRATGAVDLSILSLSGSLNNIAPTNLGASSYKPPQP